jgi:hypothetical protein
VGVLWLSPDRIVISGGGFSTIRPDGSGLKRIREGLYADCSSADGRMLACADDKGIYHAYDMVTGTDRIIPMERVTKEKASVSFCYLSQRLAVCYFYRLGNYTVEAIDLVSMKSTPIKGTMVDWTSQISPDLTKYWTYYHGGDQRPSELRVYNLPKDISDYLKKSH